MSNNKFDFPDKGMEFRSIQLFKGKWLPPTAFFGVDYGKDESLKKEYMTSPISSGKSMSVDTTILLKKEEKEIHYFSK